MTIMGLDLGTKRIGIAVSDELNSIAHAIGVFPFQQKEFFFKRLAQVVEERQVQELVVGIPVNMNGSLGPKAKEALEFVESLKTHFRLPVHPWDERLTTLQGTKLLVEAGLSRKRRHRVIDSLAAQILLQGYLDSKGDNQR